MVLSCPTPEYEILENPLSFRDCLIVVFLLGAFALQPSLREVLLDDFDQQFSFGFRDFHVLRFL